MGDGRGLQQEGNKSKEEQDEEYQYSLRPETDERKYLLFDALTDDSEKVVSRLTKTLTAVRGGESNELGFAANEKHRLREAWLLQLKLEFNSKYHHKVAFTLQFLITILSFGTTLAVVLHQVFTQGQAEQPHALFYLGAACSILPLVSSLFQTVFGSLSPVNKFAYLALGAAQAKSIIYKYRARVGQFCPSSTTAELNEMLAKKGEGAAKRPQGLGPQANFAAALQSIEASATADMKDSSMRLPGVGDFTFVPCMASSRTLVARA